MDNINDCDAGTSIDEEEAAGLSTPNNNARRDESEKRINRSKHKTIQCFICEKQFSRKSNLTAHWKNHVEDFPCTVCCNSYISQFKLDVHLATHSVAEIAQSKQSPANTVACNFDECRQKFVSKFELFEHRKVHVGVVEFECDICTKKFSKETFLEAHKLKHQLFDCEICGKKFVSKRTLTDHVSLHTGLKAYSCKVCHKKFRCQSGLKQHETLHNGVKKYKCRECNKEFSRSNYLKEHLRMHDNVKPFQCALCQTSFIQSNILKRHMQRMHRRCPLCDEIVGNERAEQAHIWSMHQDQKHLLEKKGTIVYMDVTTGYIGEQTVESSKYE